MAYLTVNKKHIAIACGSKAIVVGLQLGDDHKSPKFCILEPPHIDLGQDRTKVLTHQTLSSTPDDLDMNKDPVELGTSLPVEQSIDISRATFSSCNTMLVLCTSKKRLELWKTADWSLVSSRVLLRSASAVKFIPSGSAVVVADKSGDAYLYSVKNPLDEATLLLGHLSMLLDILVTPDEKYVITCDRDEKIRVSNFPNAYNIHSYCLGHEQFVSHIDFLPHELSLLASSSGDGTLKFWDYASGKPTISTVNCSKDWCASCPDFKNKDTTSSEIFPVKHFTCCKIESQVSIVCALLSGVRGCLIYKACSASDTFDLSIIQILNFELEPWDAALTDTNQLWILSPVAAGPISVFELMDQATYIPFKPSNPEEYVSQCIEYINERSALFSSITPPKDLTVLYKRKFDNLQEYHERKKIRQLAHTKAIAQ